MKENSRFSIYFLRALFIIVAILFVAKFAGAPLLRSYVEAGIGNCKSIPIFCMGPEQELINPSVDREYLKECIAYDFPKLKISVPRGFTVVQEMIRKVYYKKNRRLEKGSVIYALVEKPNFFPDLFPEVKRQGINDNYTFIKRVMNARMNNIKDINDAFFVIIKGVFIPDIGDQVNARMAYFAMPDKRGYINYNLTKRGNYFDCNIINNDGVFIKVYIKDASGRLDLGRVFAIISSAAPGAAG